MSTTRKEKSDAVSASRVDLWISTDEVLTVGLDRSSTGFPPCAKQCARLNAMIQGLARAANAVVFQAENDETATTEFTMQPIRDIADAIVLLSQLSQGVSDELHPVGS